MTITIDDVKSKLLPLDEVRERLARTEPFTTHEFGADDHVAFRFDADFSHGLDALPGNLPIPGYVSIGQSEFQLTRNALYEMASKAKVNKSFLETYPAATVAEVFNTYIVAGMGKEKYKFFVLQNGNAAALTRASVSPYSNLRLLETILDRIEARYGQGEVLADYKMVHDLQQTHLRLIIPEHMRTIENSGTEDDIWSGGIQFVNSLIGLGSTEINSYLFRYWCTNGAIDTRNQNNAVWSRRGKQGQNEDAVYEWAREAVDEAFEGFDTSLDSIQNLTDITIKGNTREAMDDVFKEFRIAAKHRDRIMNTMLNEANLTAYSLMQAITEAANADDLNPGEVRSLMEIGGRLPSFVEHGRCNENHPCGRFLNH